MVNAIYVLTLAVLYLFFRYQLRTNNSIVDYTVVFMFEFVISFLLMSSGDLYLFDWVNNTNIVLLPSNISFFIGMVFMIIMLMKALVFVNKELKVLSSSSA